MIGACLALTFIKEVPMHPQEIVGYTETIEDGVKRYHCPAKGDSVICRYCVTEAVERRTVPSFGSNGEPSPRSTEREEMTIE